MYIYKENKTIVNFFNVAKLRETEIEKNTNDKSMQCK